MEHKSSGRTDSVSRRAFIRTSAAGVAAALAGKNIVFAGPAKKKFKVALLGCGGRGTGALAECVNAASFLNLELEVVATADWFRNKALETGKKYNVPESRCFGGADGYKKLLESDAEVVLTAAPPNFRPVHFEAAVKAGKHVFMEKPVAVDPPGARRVMAAGDLAGQKGLSVVAGTQRRHQATYLKSAYAVEHGAIGKIRGGCIWWCGTVPFTHPRKSDQNDADYMVDNWVNFAEMSGDHIVEQHVHNIDIANWFIGHPPIRALGFGGRARRKTGNQYDFFSVQYDYADDLHIHSMCRQLSGTYTRASEHFVGSEGDLWGGGAIEGGKEIDIPEFPEYKGPYVQEHIDLLKSILDGKPINEAHNVARSTMTAIMGRISTYTGQLVRWSDLMENKESLWYDLTLKPTAEDFEKGDVVAPKDDVVPVPGRD